MMTSRTSSAATESLTSVNLVPRSFSLRHRIPVHFHPSAAKRGNRRILSRRASLLVAWNRRALTLIKAWYQNGNRKWNPNEERTIPGIITLAVILAVPITASVIPTTTAAVASMITAVVISTGVMISSLIAAVSSTRLGRSNSDYC
jgi:hypothetical protein